MNVLLSIVAGMHDHTPTCVSTHCGVQARTCTPHTCVNTWMNKLPGDCSIGGNPCSLPLALQKKSKFKVGAVYSWGWGVVEHPDSKLPFFTSVLTLKPGTSSEFPSAFSASRQKGGASGFSLYSSYLLGSGPKPTGGVLLPCRQAVHWEGFYFRA